ncbi:hypothetical protein [Paenibacillus elgii]|uniref:hypothetical protein n=1 Tax=Paenibacillus elgii TaxID=189691 RepID=UPI000248DDBD|nr:hypothetical protein [Paenibacillus elgii]
MKKFAVASLVAALSLTMLAGGASASGSNLGTFATKSQILTHYSFALKVGDDKQLDNYAGSVKFKLTIVQGRYDTAVSVTPDGYVRAWHPGRSLVTALDQNGNVVDTYEFVVWGQ